MKDGDSHGCAKKRGNGEIGAGDKDRVAARNLARQIVICGPAQTGASNREDTAQTAEGNAALRERQTNTSGDDEHHSSHDASAGVFAKHDPCD